MFMLAPFPKVDGITELGLLHVANSVNKIVDQVVTAPPSSTEAQN